MPFYDSFLTLKIDFNVYNDDDDRDDTINVTQIMNSEKWAENIRENFGSILLNKSDTFAAFTCNVMYGMFAEILGHCKSDK